MERSAGTESRWELKRRVRARSCKNENWFRRGEFEGLGLEAYGVGLEDEERDWTGVVGIGMSCVELKVRSKASYGGVFLRMN